jgi:DNA repair protein RadC
MHDGHRSKVKNRYLAEGLDNFAHHNMLELLLFYAIPRRDVNELAHLLIDTFGSISSVFDAPYEELAKIPGIGDNAAILLKLIPDFSRQYNQDKSITGDLLNTKEKAAEYLRARFIGRTNEIVVMTCLNNKCKALTTSIVFEGSVNAANVSIRKMVELALKVNATAVYIAHNHPQGFALPSQDDIATTRKLFNAFSLIGIELIDHFIFAQDNDYVSLSDSCQFTGIFSNNSSR